MNIKPQILLIYSLLFFVFVNTSLISCSQDEDLIDLVGLEDPKEEPKEPNEEGNGEGEETDPDPDGGSEETDNESDFDSSDGLKISTTPCDFLLSDAVSNSTIEIDCQMDLKGQTVNLPAGVTLTYTGGEIINGTLNFSSQGVLDGNLLNKDLDIKGDVVLEDKAFLIFPERWNLVQGQTTSEIALDNRNELEDIFTMVKRLDGHTAKLDKIDAYFEVSKVTSTTSNQNFYASTEAINVPSDFNLVMTENTILRVYPNNRKIYALIGVHDDENVTIQGGILIGDRDQHDYGGEAQEWGHLIFLKGARNTTISGVTMKNAMGDGMKIESLRFYYQADYVATENVIVRNCIFDSNRRNNMSITGGSNIRVENNTFLNASIDTNYSEGVDPGFAIDVEATRTRQEDGSLLYYERAEDIFISDNIEKNSRVGGFIVAIGYDVTIQNNTVESGISYSLANGTRIINNTVIAKDDLEKSSGTGIKAGKSNADDATIYNNEVSGNRIIGFGTGIRVTNKETKVFNNIIEDSRVGISLVKLTDTEITNNTIKSNRDDSIGVSTASTTLTGVVISNNEIAVQRNPIKLFRTNQDAIVNNRILIKDNTLLTNQKSLFSESKGIDFIGNTLNHGIEISNSEGLIFDRNIISSGNAHGFELREVNYSIEITNNSIDVDSGRECIRIENSTDSNQVTDSNNSCI